MPPSESERRATGLKESRELLRDLFEPRPGRYWPDFLLSAALGHAALLSLVCLPLSPAYAIPLFGVAVLASYRALLFIHELTHLKGGALPGFRLAWNGLVGVPMLVSSATYEGVHTDHHRRTVYGTARDPEYMPYARLPRWVTLKTLVEAAFVPAVLLLRFVVVAPLSWLLPPLRRWVETRASALVINLAYQRPPLTPALAKSLRWSEVVCFLLWGGLLSAMALEWLPWRVLAAWYAVSSGVALLNQVRTLAAHRFAGDGAETDVVGQIEDTVDIRGGPWTEIWAPVGLRFHALHHFLPDLPYHSLAEAHGRLLGALPKDAALRRAQESSLAHALWVLWARPRSRPSAETPP